MILSIVNELIFKFPPNKQMLQLFFRNIPHVHLHEKRRTRNTIVELKFKLSYRRTRQHTGCIILI